MIGVKKIMLKVCLCESNIVSIKFVTSIFVKKKKNYENYYISRVCLDTTYFAENWKHCSKIIFKCVNNTRDPFLMKVLLKKEVCGSYEQCTGPIINHWNARLNEKKRETHNTNVKLSIQTDTWYENAPTH